MGIFRILIRKVRIGLHVVSCHYGHMEILSRYIRFLKTWNLFKRNKLKLTVLLLVTFFTIPWGRFQTSTSKGFKTSRPDGSLEKVVIGIVACAGGIANVGRGKNETRAMNEAAEEPLTLIKSVLLSGKVSKLKQVEFHIVTDSWMLKQTIQKTVDKFIRITKGYINMAVYYYNAFDSVPRGYERDFVDNIRRCGYVRLFFPFSLPTYLTEILYLDTDVIITGSIVQIWKKFKEKVVNVQTPKLAAMVQNSEVFGKYYLDIFADHFLHIPHVPPRGVNSGVIFMNLDAMRKFNWTGKVMDIFIQRRDKLGGDQQLINVLFHNYLDSLEVFPCQYNFQHLHCEKGLACRNVTTDPGGIQIMHGAGGLFHKKGRSHIGLYFAFNKFSLELHDNVVSRLYKPLIQFYSKVYLMPRGNGMVTCHGTIGKYLFKEMVTYGS